MRIIFFLNILFLSALAKAQDNSLIIADARYAVDSVSQWNTANFPLKAFRKTGSNQLISIGYNEDATVWCLLTLKNTDTINEQRSWLCFNNNYLDTIVLYDKGSIKILGDRTEYVSPFLETQAFEVSMHPGETRVLTARLKKGISYLEFSFGLQQRKALAQKSVLKVAVISGLLGIIFVLLLFNSILFYITRNKMYILYILYSVLSATYIMISSYYAKYLLFNGFIYFSEMRIYTSSFWLMSLIAFLCHYIEMKTFQPKKYRIIIWLNGINIFIIATSIIGLAIKNHDYIKISFLLGYVIFFTAIVITIWAAVYNIRNKRSASIYVLLAFLPHFIWGLGIILKTFNITGKDLHEDVLIYICLYEVMLFGYVLTKNYIDAFHKNNHLMQEILLEKEKSLQAISMAQIRERRNIANIIHDKLGSKIAYIMQLLELKKPEDAKQNMNELAMEIRDISHKILPKSLDDGALAASLKNQVETWNAALACTKIEIFNFDFPESLQQEWIYDIYLIAIELINNALKHGNPQQVSVELYAYPEMYVFQFTDDGIGFDVETAEGFGLQNIKKRILHYDGEFEINSSHNQGTIIQISLPVRT